MPLRDPDTWCPLFDSEDFVYQSFLVMPTAAEGDAPPGTAVQAKKWAKAPFVCGRATATDGGYLLEGTLRLAPGVELSVSAKGALGSGGSPATFEATGVAVEGRAKGASYRLVGWVFADAPTAEGGSVSSVSGSVQAVRGPDPEPTHELGGMPVGTVGAFVIAKRTPSAGP